MATAKTGTGISAKRTKTAALPQSKAKTAYELLNEVKRVILADPKRYDQGVFIARKSSDALNVESYPACGTVACVAGWACILKDRGQAGTTIDMAAWLLGLNNKQADALFSVTAFNTTALPQTRAYARAGAQHITRFQQRYKKALKAHGV